MARKGFYVVLEGGEGGGKTTQLLDLTTKARQQFPGREIVALREPGSTKVGEEIRDILLNKELAPQEMNPRTEALLFAAARCQFLEEKVRPALERDAFVVVDRCFTSSMVYQGIVRGLGTDYVWRINKDLVSGLIPDLIFVLDLDPEIGLKRREGSGKIDRIDKENLDFHRKVREGYLKIAQTDSGLYTVIDATLSREVQAEQIWGEVCQRMADRELDKELVDSIRRSGRKEM